MKTFGITLIAALSAAVLSTGARAQDEGEIKIGLAVASSGWLQAYDDNSTKMVKLWIDDINAEGGLLGKKVTYVVVDTKSDRAEGAKAGQALAAKDVDLIFVSGDYDFGAPAALQAEKAGIISAFFGASDPKAGVLGVGPLSFTTGVAGQVEGATLAEWAVKEKNLTKGFLLLDNSIEYNKSVCAGYEWNIGRVGGTLVDSDAFRNDDLLISSQVTHLSNAIRDKGVDHVMLCSYTPGGASAIKQIRNAGIDLPVLAATAMDGTYWLDSVPDLANFYVPVQAVAGNDARPEVQALTKRYIDANGEAPTTQYAYPAYPFLDLWAQAVRTVGSTEGELVAKQLETLSEAPTLMGPRTFTDKLHIQVQMPLVITELTGGTQQVVGDYQISEPIPADVLYRTNK